MILEHTDSKAQMRQNHLLRRDAQSPGYSKDIRPACDFGPQTGGPLQTPLIQVVQSFYNIPIDILKTPSANIGMFDNKPNRPALS